MVWIVMTTLTGVINLYWQMTSFSQFFEILLELHLFLLYKSRFIDLVRCLHGQLSLQNIQHILGR